MPWWSRAAPWPSGCETRDEPWAAVLGATILVGLLIAERLLRPAARHTVPVVANLPGLVQPRPLPDLGLPVVLAGLAANGVGLLIAALDASAWWWFGAAVVAAVPAAVVVMFGRTKRGQARSITERLPDAVAAFAPEFVVYTSRPDDASYQVAMWLPYLERAGRPFMIMTRSRVPAEALARITSVPVVEARAVRTVDSLALPSVRAAFYVNASSGNGAFVRNTGIQHVYLGHGDSDKPPSYNPTHAMYDQIFAAGPAAIRRTRPTAYTSRRRSSGSWVVRRSRMCDPPRPRSPPSTIRPCSMRRPGAAMSKRRCSTRCRRARRSSPRCIERGATVIFRPHPFSYDYPEDAETVRRIQQRLAADARGPVGPICTVPKRRRTRSILDVINASDAMVSDVSSVVSDYLFSGKPLAMVAVPAEPDAFIAEYPIARASYVIRRDLSESVRGAGSASGQRPAGRSAVRGPLRLSG